MQKLVSLNAIWNFRFDPLWTAIIPYHPFPNITHYLESIAPFSEKGISLIIVAVSCINGNKRGLPWNPTALIKLFFKPLLIVLNFLIFLFEFAQMIKIFLR